MSELIVASDPEWNAERHAKMLCDEFGGVLAKEYPGYRWRVEAKPHQGIVDIRCEHASGRAGYTFNLKRNGMPDRAAIVRGGGEVLERFSLNRRGFHEAEYRDLPRFCGQLTPEW